MATAGSGTLSGRRPAPTSGGSLAGPALPRQATWAQVQEIQQRGRDQERRINQLLRETNETDARGRLEKAETALVTAQREARASEDRLRSEHGRANQALRKELRTLKASLDERVDQIATELRGADQQLREERTIADQQLREEQAIAHQQLREERTAAEQALREELRTVHEQRDQERDAALAKIAKLKKSVREDIDGIIETIQVGDDEREALDIKLSGSLSSLRSTIEALRGAAP
jgi:chromosome segregation ATPase